MEIFENDNGTFEIEVSRLLFQLLKTPDSFQIFYHRLNKVVHKAVPDCGLECPAEKFYELYKNRALFSLKEVQEVCFVGVGVNGGVGVNVGGVGVEGVGVTVLSLSPRHVLLNPYS